MVQNGGVDLKKKVNQKERMHWRRITVNISDELYELLEQRAGLAGVSLSRFAFAVLKRKKVLIIPGFAEFVYQLRQISRELNRAQYDPTSLREVVAAINRNVEFFESSTQGVLYPRLVETKSGKCDICMQSNQFIKNMVEV